MVVHKWSQPWSTSLLCVQDAAPPPHQPAIALTSATISCGWQIAHTVEFPRIRKLALDVTASSVLFLDHALQIDTVLLQNA